MQALIFRGPPGTTATPETVKQYRRPDESKPIRFSVRSEDGGMPDRDPVKLNIRTLIYFVGSVPDKEKKTVTVMTRRMKEPTRMPLLAPLPPKSELCPRQ